MSRRIEVFFDDDLDKTIPAVTTITFGVDTDAYELDLCKGNDEKFRRLLQPWIDAAHKVEALHAPLPTGPDREEIELKQRIRDQLHRMYEWALPIPEMKPHIGKKNSPGAFPYLRRPLKDAYFESHPDDPEIK